MRLVVLAFAMLGARTAAAQVTPGAPDHPAEQRDPAAPEPGRPPVEVPPSPTAATPANDEVPPIPVVPQPPPQPAPPPPPRPREPPRQLDASTSVEWNARYHFDWHWQLLMLPERAIELAFIPIGLLVRGIETYRLDKRLADVLSVENLQVELSPRFKFAFGDGAGAGLWIERRGIVSWRSHLRGGGIVRFDRDWQVELEYEHALLFPGGRGLRTRAYVERDKNQRFYGIGGGTTDELDRRALQVYEQGGLVEVDLQGIDRYTTSGIAQLGFRRQELSAGVDPGFAPVMTGDTVAPPQGFDQVASYVDARIVGRYDTRDTTGRPTRGVVVEGSVLGRTEVTGRDLSATTLSAGASLHLPIIAEHRTLVFTLAGAAALPLFPGHERPLDSLAVIGRANVRGYDRERFRDLYAIVASAEYRFPIYEYLASRIGLDAFVFFDAGTIWGRDDFSRRPRYSFGGGLRGASETDLYLVTTLGYSPEGPQVNIGVESAL